MCPPIIAAIAAIAAAVIPVVANAVGEAAAKGDNAEAMRLRKEAAAKYGDAILPRLDALLQRDLPPSAFAAITENSSVVGTQEEMLRALAEEASTGGSSAQSRMANNRARNEANRYFNGQQGSIQQSLGQRGLTGSGLDYALQQQAAQGASNMFADQAMQAEAGNADRALMAKRAAADLAGNIRQQDWQVSSAKAQAADEIAKWNENNRQQVAMYNNGLNQQQFGNQMAKAQGYNNAVAGVANQYQQQGQQTWQNANNVGAFAGSAVNSAGQSAAGYYAYLDAKKKEEAAAAAKKGGY